jgi:hypothetical protein
MSELKQTKIYRCGITAPVFNPETNDCSFKINIRERTLDFRFNLASKGGGTTVVLLQLGLDDFKRILENVADVMPENVAGTLSDCAALASKKILEQLAKALQAQNDEKVALSSAVEQLEAVEEFVSKKWCEAPPGQDQTESAAKSQLEAVIDSLRARS